MQIDNRVPHMQQRKQTKQQLQHTETRRHAPSQDSYLNPQPVPPRIIAASRIAPATEPIMILVPLGPVGAKSARMRAERESRGGSMSLCC